MLELHRDVRFDLFHANWPYSGELLYLGKNYPNVAIDFCWANIIDPVYCQNMFKQALSCVPHGKIHGYGSDFGGTPDRAWAHASIARDNIAIALSDMVEIDYLGLDDAKEVARALALRTTPTPSSGSGWRACRPRLSSPPYTKDSYSGEYIMPRMWAGRSSGAGRDGEVLRVGDLGNAHGNSL